MFIQRLLRCAAVCFLDNNKQVRKSFALNFRRVTLDIQADTRVDMQLIFLFLSDFNQHCYVAADVSRSL